MNTDGLASRVEALCDRTTEALPQGPVAAAVHDIRQGLAEPLRVAVVGRIKAGKSTLVNALIGRKVAPTDVGECTKVVTWFRFGVPGRGQVRLRDGTEHDLPLGSDAVLPEALPHPPERIAAVDVWLAEDFLRRMTLIDTPGLASLDEASSQATHDLLHADNVSRDASRHAEAVIYLLTHDIRADDAAILDAFAALRSAEQAFAVNAVGVLSKADKVAGGRGDVLTEAEALAARMHDQLRASLDTVVPAIALLAESADRLNEQDAAAVRTLAAQDERTRKRMLLSATAFLRATVDVDLEQRRRLLELLDRFGLGRLLALATETTPGAAVMARELRTVSGIDRIRRQLTLIATRTEGLKAAWAINALESLAYDGDATGTERSVLLDLRGQLDDLRVSQEMHLLRFLTALQSCAAGQATLPDELLEDLRTAAGGATLPDRLGLASAAQQAQLQAALVERITRWREFAQHLRTPPAAKRLASEVYQAYESMWPELGT